MKYKGKDIRVVTAEIKRDGRYLIARRPQKGVLPGLWEFPGGRVRDGEDDDAALVRKLSELLGVESPTVGERLLAVDHEYPHYNVHLRTYSVDLGDARPLPADGREIAWVAPEDFESYQFPAADEHTVELLCSELVKE